MKLNKPYTNKEYADLAVFCNINNCHIEDNGDYLKTIKNTISEPTKAEIANQRKAVYITEVDPLTAQIQRLRDEEQTADIITEINSLVAERAAKVAEIKQRFPYPEEITESEVQDESIVA